jgi:hypothetical protein
MPSNRKITLPKKATGAAPGLVSPAQWNRVVEALAALLAQTLENSPQSGADIGIRKSAGGWVPYLKRRGGRSSASTDGPFCKVYKDYEEEEWKLIGGTVTAGGGTETIADITIGEFGDETAPPADGTFYWLACVVDANEEDDVLLPGGTLTAVTVDSGETLPDNIIPEVGAIEGTIHIALGEWMNGKFIPAGCGNLQISHCPGSLTYMRGIYYPFFF